uniref:Uncharacterized protein n=1 Tax=Faecalibaculum rodentium TaxID=1702221 RepID=A0A140DVQ6_9FIRM|nr:hypothetical protein AALO17_15990 [Faecalibaculum rodentium]
MNTYVNIIDTLKIISNPFLKFSFSDFTGNTENVKGICICLHIIG